jgi:DNA mismatch endonuclease (patch repair protein)
MDNLTKEQRSRTMSKIKSSSTAFEKQIFRELRKRGIRFRTHYCGVVGKPDIALPRSRKAVFLHSDFWHGWRLPAWEHILPSDFWKIKLQKNRKRDQKVKRILRRQGWNVAVLWEHSFRSNPDVSLGRLVQFLSKRS